MTPRERWLTLLAGKTPDRIPTDYWATTELHAKLKSDLAVSDDEQLWQRLHIDRPVHVADPLFGATPLKRSHSAPHVPEGQDMWGVQYRSIEYGSSDAGGGTYNEADFRPLEHATSVGELRAYKWPSPDDFDYSGVTRFVDAQDGSRPICAGVYEPFLLYCLLRGLEQGFEDLLVNTDIADAILGKLFDFFHEHNRRIFAAGKGKIDVTYIAEDLGGQTGPLFSLEVYRRFFLPNQKRMADLARSFGIHVMYHTDGAARAFLPDLIDVVGIEILNPIQWRCPGMEIESLVRDFGKSVIFHGAMDNQQTMPFGSTQDVADEVKRNIELFSGSRWICAPCHNLQNVTPTANVVAMYETIHEAGALNCCPP